MSKRKFYTIREEKFIVENYETMTRTELAAELGRTVASVCNKIQSLKLSKSTNAGRFTSKTAPWNKGKKQPNGAWSPDTTFKPGNMPATARPSGAMYIRNDRYAQLWYFKPENSRRVVPYHRYRWQQLHGEIPAGHVVAFRDGNTLNIEDSNLILKSRAQLANENQAKCNKKAAGERAWATRCGMSAVDRVLMCMG